MKNDRTQYLLWQLAQECNEVAHRVSKAAQFGLDETQPEQPYTNKERLTQECTDLLAVIGICLADGIIFNPNDKTALIAKQAKIETYMDYARAYGTLE